jgi:hypothetical protein
MLRSNEHHWFYSRHISPPLSPAPHALSLQTHSTVQIPSWIYANPSYRDRRLARLPPPNLCRPQDPHLDSPPNPHLLRPGLLSRPKRLPRLYHPQRTPTHPSPRPPQLFCSRRRSSKLPVARKARALEHQRFWRFCCRRKHRLWRSASKIEPAIWCLIR